MANRKRNGNTYKGIIIDTAPGANGYYTDPVSAMDHRVGQLILNISGVFAGTVVLQYRNEAFNQWRTYDTYTDYTRQIIEDYTKCEWRAGIASGGLTSGVAYISIDYHDGESV